MLGMLGFTWNPPSGVEVPFGVVTVKLLKPVEAFGAMVRVTERLEDLYLSRWKQRL
jgi:hypothetical protein